MYEQKQVKEISVDDLKKALTRKSKNIMVMDAREITAYYKGHIPGACSMFDAEIASEAKNLDKNLTFVIYGPGQAVPSPPPDRLAVDAAMRLMNAGFNNVCVLRGGFEAWANAGNRIDSSQPGSVKPASVPLFTESVSQQ